MGLQDSKNSNQQLLVQLQIVLHSDGSNLVQQYFSIKEFNILMFK